MWIRRMDLLMVSQIRIGHKSGKSALKNMAPEDRETELLRQLLKHLLEMNMV